MGAIYGAIGLAAIVGSFIIAVALLISPLMIWKHTLRTSEKLDKIIELLKK